MTERVRFAPSPSGYLHVGGARTALFNWLWARKHGGTFIVRVEDTDQERSSVENVKAVLDALTWLGLDWDEGPLVGGPHEPYFQSERRGRYQEVTRELIAKGAAYRCYCTKEQLDAARAEALARNPKAPFRYPGTCRNEADDPSRPHVVRFRSPQAGSTDFNDLVFGTISTPNESQYDHVLVRGDGFPVYNFACVIDDHDMGITLVGRGRDHIGNTPQQLLLYQAMNWEPPRFAHLPLMLDKKGAKLSKRVASVAVQDYRERGYSPNGVLNYLARFGWSFGDQEIFTLPQLVQAFSWERCGRADGRFDEAKFADVAFEHLKEPSLMSAADYLEGARPFIEQRGLSIDDPASLSAAIELVRPRARTFVEAADAIDYFFREPPTFDPKAQSKFLDASAAPLLAELGRLLAAQPVWDAAGLEEAVKHWSEQANIKMKDIAQPARVALTGRSASPGLFDVMVVLGRERSLARLEHGAELARSSERAE